MKSTKINENSYKSFRIISPTYEELITQYKSPDPAVSWAYVEENKTVYAVNTNREWYPYVRDGQYVGGVI